MARDQNLSMLPLSHSLTNLNELTLPSLSLVGGVEDEQGFSVGARGFAGSAERV